MHNVLDGYLLIPPSTRYSKKLKKKLKRLGGKYHVWSRGWHFLTKEKFNEALKLCEKD